MGKVILVGWIGNQKRVVLPTETNLLSISNYLNSIHCQILCQDYKELLSLVKEGNFLFIDPPYDVSFKLYAANKFTQNNQRELLRFLQEVDNKGING